MVRQGIDRGTIAHAAYTLAEEHGLAALGIRNVAEACDVSVGTIYKYFPTKDDLVVEVIGTFWRKAFSEDMCRIVPGERFDAFTARLYETLGSALAAFRSDWLPQISALSIQGRDTGKMRESQVLDHMRDGLLAVLLADDAADLSRLGLPAEQLAAFVRDSILASLCAGGDESEVLVALLRAALYEPLKSHAVPQGQAETVVFAGER
ncbi:MAG: helix-turn-helix domain-containing protein [Gordonibacter sp.]|nr:helix-turn-helix domain-containing protein [Gordonibacter sp.]